MILSLYSALVRPHLQLLHPALGSSAKERSVGASPEKCQKADLRAEATPLWIQAERAGVTQPGEHNYSLPVLKGSL